MRSWLGSTEIVLEGVCDRCSGDGKLAATNRAAYEPEKYPDEIVTCPDCHGIGGDSEEAAAHGRKMSDMYAKALSVK